MAVVKFSPKALNFGYDFVLLVHFFGTPCIFENMCLISVKKPCITFVGARVEQNQKDLLCLRTFVKMFLLNFVFVRSGDRAQPNVGGTYLEPNYALWSWSTIGTKKSSLLEHNSD